jgi:hypothetical protein
LRKHHSKHHSRLRQLRKACTLWVLHAKGNEEKQRCLCPVFGKALPFFISAKNRNNQPKNAVFAFIVPILEQWWLAMALDIVFND